jgi:NAD(P)H-dependent FMN reductase
MTGTDIPDTTTDRPLRLAVLIGSTREGRAGAAIARWFLTHVERHAGFEVDVLDLLDMPLPARLTEDTTPEQEAWAARIAAADAYVVVTPEYNHSFPAALKHAIDCAYEEWFAKPVGFVSYGGLGRGLRAVEQLRLVFAELHASTVRDGVSINLDDGVDATGWVSDASAGRAAKSMLDQLAWWGRTLRAGRAERPYAA